MLLRLHPLIPGRARVLCGILAGLLGLGAAQANPDFSLLCAPCHGDAGRGDGPAADLMWPRPADLTGPLKLGPAERAIVRGVPGTMMPAFGDLPTDRRAALVAFVVGLGGDPGPVVDVPARPDPLPDPAVGEALWTSQGCAGCHAAVSRTRALQHADLFDVFARPLKGGDDLEALFVTLTRGRPGTPMIGRPDLSADARWALAAYIRARRRDIDATPRLPPPGAIKAARDGLWQTIPTPAFETPVPILQSRRAAQCGRCHPKTHAQWIGSRHALATGPGLVGQYAGRPAAFARGCDRCHAPQVSTPSEAAHADGVSCVGCHVRGHGKVVSPGDRSTSPPGVPLVGEPRLVRSDFCMPCHNLPLAAAVDGRPLLDTWREWAQSPYLPAGIQCQTCHLGQGDHRMAGAHDADAVRRAVEMQVGVPRVEAGALVVSVTLRNVGAGHHFPTTATPRAVLRVRQVAGHQTSAPKRLAQTEMLWAIGRTVEHGASGWREIADTRIPAGETRMRTYRVARAPGADAIEVDLHFFPDWFYTTVFRGQLARGDLSEPARAAFEAALADGQGSVIRVDWQVRSIQD